MLKIGFLGCGGFARLPEPIEPRAQERRRVELRIRRDRAVDPHRPGRPMPGERILLIALHRAVAHPGEIIVRLVVGADMIEAEAKELALVIPALGRAKLALERACRVFAARLVLRPRRLGSPPGADLVEQRGVEIHHRTSLGSPPAPGQARDGQVAKKPLLVPPNAPKTAP